MRNPTFLEPEERPETIMAIGLEGHSPIFSAGIRTITHNRSGLKLYPHEVIVLEMKEGEEIAAFDLTPSLARMYAEKLHEMADKIDAKTTITTTIRHVAKDISDAPH